MGLSIDRKKVIKGLECHAEVNCVECPYRDGWRTCNFGETLLADALILLKEQETQKFFVDEFGKITPLPVVVSCKDCRYGEQLFPDYISCKISDENESGCHASHKPDWFCADGKRRGDDA